MADSTHYSLTSFRDSLLTALARLEFELRDGRPSVPSVPSVPQVSSDRLDSIETSLASLQKTVQMLCEQTAETKALMSIPPPSQSKNVLVSTPALSAAVAGLMPSGFDLEPEEESELEEEEESEDENEIPIAPLHVVVKLEPSASVDIDMTVVPEVVVAQPIDVDMTEEEEEDEESVEESEEEDPELRPVTIQGKTYYLDADNTAYVETDEGYEEVGTYNPKLNSVEGVEEADEEIVAEEEETEEIEVEDFVFKGKTYQRDTEGNVYLDGEQIGTWNGKKILPLA